MKQNVAFGGISRIPGGAVSSDGDLAAAVDVCNDGMGLEMLEKPQELFTLDNGEELLCIHEPEGRGKHYITQIIVPTSPISNEEPSVEPGIEPGDDPEPSEPITPRSISTRRIGFADHAEDIVVNGDILDGGGGGAGGGGGYSGGGGSGSSTYTDPNTGPTLNEDFWFDSGGGHTLSDAYDEVIGDESDARDQDDGGADADTETVGNIYLRWNIDNGNGTRTVKQSLDITSYGKVTTIQPMGNTLICNHEGSEYYLPEIRYYLWKEDSEIVDSVAVDTSKYVGLGPKPPMLNITFGLESEFKYWPETKTPVTDSDYPKKYKGTSITCYPYTDTVGVWWSSSLGTSYVPPYALYGNYTTNTTHWQETYSIENVVSPDGKTDVAGIKINWTTMTLGCYNKFIAEQHNKNRFVFPFYCRYAYELYDGSLIMHSYPVLMIPNSRGPIFALDGKYGLKADRDDPGETYEKVRIDFRGRTYGFSSKLLHDIVAMADADLARLKNWKDLIRGVNIYVTPPIYNYKQGGQVLGWHCMDKNAPNNDGENPWKKHYTVGRVKYGSSSTVEGHVTLDQGFTTMLGTDAAKIFLPWVDTSVTPNVTYSTPDYCLTIPQKEEKEITELHENAGQFYKLATIEYETLIKRLDAITGDSEGESELEIGKKIVNTISNQDVMQDDNGSHDTLSANVLYGYNRRLNMASVNKIMHAPLQPKVQWAREYYKTTGLNPTTEEHMWQINIYAKNGGRIALMKTTANDVNVRWPLYVFYPNVNATEAVLIHGDTRYKVRLREHKALNGVFWLGDFYNKFDDLRDYRLNPVVYENNESHVGECLSLKNVNRTVDESNKIYTTETDNPFAVPFGNINIAGGGEIRALCSATQAMSQGQFGMHPMYCFTSEGVWALSVNDTGGWATIQPVTRDVIAEGTQPLSLDSTVVFLTERGLLNLAGADVKILSDVLQQRGEMTVAITNVNTLQYWNQWKRIHELASATQMLDLYKIAFYHDLNKFPEKARLAYDYDNARIYVTPFEDADLEAIEDVNNVPVMRGSWVYNLKSGLWTQSSTVIDRQIPSYPELITQSGGKVVLVSVDRAYPNNLKSKGFVVTRPLKLGDSGLLKRWHQMVVRGQFKPYQQPIFSQATAPVQCAVFGTRNWYEYPLIGSSDTNRWSRRMGTPFFAHSVALFLRNQRYMVQFSGMDIEVDAEHDNKLR